MLIDFHAHIFPDRLAPGAISSLSERASIPPYSNGTADGLLSRMKLWNTDRSVILNIATNPRQTQNVNAFALSLLEYPQFIPFGSVHPDCDDPGGVVAALHGAGIKGIKLHPDYIKYVVDDIRYDPIFKKAAELGMIAVIHAGYDFISPDFIHSTPERIEKVLDRYPGLRLVCAHMGGNRMWDEVLKRLCGREVWFDTSLTAWEMSPEMLCKILDNHGEDKILFGSDMPWCPTPAVAGLIKNCGLSEERQEKIFYKNAMALLGL